MTTTNTLPSYTVARYQGVLITVTVHREAAGKHGRGCYSARIERNDGTPLPAAYRPAAMELTRGGLTSWMSRMAKRAMVMTDAQRPEPKGDAAPEPTPAPVPVPDAAPKYTTREEWLVAAVNALRPMFSELDKPIPDTLQVSASPIRSKAIGLAYDKGSSYDGTTRTIVICASLTEPLHRGGVLPTLVHELVHAAVGNEHGHRAPFKRVALALGLQGKMTATVAGDELLAKLAPIAADLGAYPHVGHKKNRKAATAPTPEKNKCSIRFKSIEVEEYRVQMSVKHFEEFGAPFDPWGNEMIPARAE
jgi:hypothetical protein